MDPLQRGDPGQIGDYRLLGRLGAGGMGQVFLGRSPGGRLVAVKIIRPEHAGSGPFRERFAREIEAARRVGGFHTAPVVDADPHADPPWMVTAYIPGPSLREAVADEGPLPLGTVRALGAGLAEGLSAIHACGLVHRDLKPGNVILASDGPRVIDFGIARAVDAHTVTETGAVLGTYAYMSPEQALGLATGPASDVFSFGSVLAFAATGHSPFSAGSIGAIVHRITTGAPDLREVPEEQGLRDLIAACLAKDPADRPSLADLLDRLSGLGARDDWLPSTVLDMVGSRESQSGAAAAEMNADPSEEERARPQPAESAARRRQRLAVVATTSVTAVLITAVGVAATMMAGDDAKEPRPTSASSGGKRQSGALSGAVKVDGSSVVAAMSTLASELFTRRNPRVRVTVGVTGTGAGFQKFCSGEIDISNASRPIRADEKRTCQARGVAYHRLTVANEALTVVVPRTNTWVRCLTAAQLKKIWAPGSKVDNWNQVDPGFPDEPLKLSGPATDSGSFAFFTMQINGEEANGRRDYQASEDDGVIARSVAGAKGGLGYFGLSPSTANADKLKAVPVDGGGGCVAPSAKSAQDGTYKPLSRPLFIYPSAAALKRPEVLAFVEHYAANAASIAEKSSFIPLDEKQSAALRGSVVALRREAGS